MIGIYKITNKINHKFYIGQSNNIERRYKEHCAPSRYLKSNIPLDWAIHKYGKENFTLEVIEECPTEKLNEREIYWIEKEQAIKLGYNCCPGGSEVHGANNPNAKLSEADVIFIRKAYDEKLVTQKEIYEIFKDKVSLGTIQSIWQGQTWTNVMPEVLTEENKEYYKKYAGIKVSGTFSDKEVIELRKLYVNNTAKDLYKNYQDKISYSSFQRILCGLSYTHLPYFHKKTKTWIRPGEEPQKNPNRCNSKIKNTTNKYSDQEVSSFRQEYVNKTAKEIYEKTDKRLCFESFQKMLNGQTYIHLPVYSKKLCKWVCK